MPTKSPAASLLRFACLTTLTLALAASSFASSKKHKIPAQPMDPNYMAALGVANRFLSAWQGSDQAAAMPLITNRAKQQSTEEGVEKFFSGSETRAFEIAHGRALRQGRYRFPIVLLQAHGPGNPRRRFGDLVIAITGKNDWAVDKLP